MSPSGLIWLIERRHWKKTSVHLNAPMLTEWRTVGNVRAQSRDSAMDKAAAITGARRSELRVTGINIGGK